MDFKGHMRGYTIWIMFD